jgi:hypothetical protein
MTQVQVFTTLNSTAQVSVKPNKFSASFSFSKTVHKDTVNDTLRRFEETTVAVLDGFKILPGSLTKMPRSSKLYRGSQGYSPDLRDVSYSVSFSSEDVESASDILDRLNNLEEVDDPSLSFTSTQFDKYEKDLLKTAFDEAQRRLEVESEVLGVKASDLKVVAWNVRADRRQNQQVQAREESYVAASAMRSMNSPKPPVKVEAGEIAVTLTLSVSYGKE